MIDERRISYILMKIGRSNEKFVADVICTPILNGKTLSANEKLSFSRKTEKKLHSQLHQAHEEPSSCLNEPVRNLLRGIFLFNHVSQP